MKSFKKADDNLSKIKLILLLSPAIGFGIFILVIILYFGSWGDPLFTPWVYLLLAVFGICWLPILIPSIINGILYSKLIKQSSLTRADFFLNIYLISNFIGIILYTILWLFVSIFLLPSNNVPELFILPAIGVLILDILVIVYIGKHSSRIINKLKKVTTNN